MSTSAAASSPRLNLNLLALLSIFAASALSQANPYAYPTWDVPYTATTTITSAGSTTITSTQYYTVISSTVTLYVGQQIAYSYLSNLSSTTLTQTPNPSSAPTTITSTLCPSNFHNTFSYVNGVNSVTTQLCLYCPSTGFYIDRGGACQTDTPYVAECAFGYGIPSSEGVTTGQTITFNPCVPSVIPPVPQCPNGYFTSSGACWTKTIQPTVESFIWTSTETFVYGTTASSTATYTGYTYVYASGIDPSTVGYGSVGYIPAVGYLTLGASSTDPAVLSDLEGVVVWYSGYVPPGSREVAASTTSTTASGLTVANPLGAGLTTSTVTQNTLGSTTTTSPLTVANPLGAGVSTSTVSSVVVSSTTASSGSVASSSTSPKASTVAPYTTNGAVTGRIGVLGFSLGAVVAGLVGGVIVL